MQKLNNWFSTFFTASSEDSAYDYFRTKDKLENPSLAESEDYLSDDGKIKHSIITLSWIFMICVCKCNNQWNHSVFGFDVISHVEDFVI